MTPRVLAVFLALLLAGCARPEAASAVEAESEPAPATTRFEAEAGPYEGSFALRVQIRADAAVSCTILLALTGVSPERADVGALLVTSGEETLLWEQFGTQATTSVHAGAHAPGARHDLDSRGPVRWLVDRDEDWGLDLTLDAQVPTNILLVATDLRPIEDEDTHFAERAREILGDATARLRVECDAPIVVEGLAGSRNARVFSERTFEGGAGAYVAGLDDTSARVGASLRVDVPEPEGVLALRAGGDILLNHLAAGTIEVTTPSHRETFVDHPQQVLAHALLGLPFIEALVHDGPGEYRVEVTWASVDAMGMIVGFVCGLAPLETLDELWGLIPSRPGEAPSPST